MKRPRFLLWFIFLLAFISAFVVLPKVHVNFSQGPLKFDNYLGSVDFEVFGARFVRDAFKLNLDLQGGTSLLLQVDMKDIKPEDRDDALASSREVIDRRVNAYGVEEPVVQTSKVGEDHRIIVDLPGIKNTDDAKKLVGQTAKLEFKKMGQSASPSADGQPAMPTLEETGLTGADLRKATPIVDPQSGKWTVQFETTAEGAKKFGEVTRALVGQPLAIVLDGQVQSAPTVQSEISTSGQISGNFSPEEAKQLAIQLNAGSLIAPINIIEERTVGATLGSESITRSLVAGLIGFIAVAIFMIGFYRWLGVLAVVALVIYTLISLALFKLIPITLGLAGIAGFILSVGMAVDANILVFERMKEELRWGRPLPIAIEAGFSRAFTSIRDSNISSLITSFILFQFGSGLVKGFAVTLALGILVSMFTALTVTKTFLKVFYLRNSR